MTDFDWRAAMSRLPSSWDKNVAELDEKDLPPPEYYFEFNVEKRRDDIRFSVLTGNLSPQKAERLAKKEGLGLFATAPIVATVETLPEIWTPEMVAIWITTKDPVAVIRHHADTCKASAIWVPNLRGTYHQGTAELLTRVAPAKLFKADPQQRKGHSLVRLGPTSLFRRYHDFLGQMCEFPELELWFPKLRDLLVAGQVSSWGVFSEGDIGRKIPADEWRFASFREGGMGGAILYVGNTPAYSEVLFSGREISERFPLESPRFRAWSTDPTALNSLSGNRRKLIESMQRSQSFSSGFPINGISKKKINAEIWQCIEDDDLKKRYEDHTNTKFYNFVENAYAAYFEDNLQGCHSAENLSPRVGRLPHR